MKKIALIIQIFLIPCLMHAHPGIGIVKDSKGNIYYTDLAKVWKITPSGEKSVVVNGVHTHELYMDLNDNLYGEHLWYNGEALDTWGHYAWCLRSNGELVKEIEPTEGFLSNYSFVRDENGNMYWVERFKETRFMKKDTSGKITEVARRKFKFIGWLHAGKDGTIYFTENNKLHRLNNDGSFTVLATDLQGETARVTTHGVNYEGYGIWGDKHNNIYIAMLGARKIQRVNTQGKVETICYSNDLWTPTSGLFDNSGDLWIYENSATNKVRVRKISADDLKVVEKPFVRKMYGVSEVIVTVVVIILLLTTIWVIMKQVSRWFTVRQTT